jgi:hypothetical protein
MTNFMKKARSPVSVNAENQRFAHRGNRALLERGFRLSSSEGLPMRHLLLPLLASGVLATGCAGEAARSPTSPTLGALANTEAQVAPAESQSAALAPQAQGGVQLPFRGSFQQTETSQPQSPTTLLVTGTGVGTATHLGRYTMTFTALVDFTAGTGLGQATFVAANGDRLFSTDSGQATPTADPGILSITEIATITGGTGRFEGATGSFTGERLLNAATGVSSGSFTGTITLAH